MYYPIGWHKVLKVETTCDQEQCDLLSIQSNHERELFFILTSRSIHIWYQRPAVEIVCHRRSKDSIEKIGFNKSAVWKPDSTVIVVATDKDQLLFYQVKRRLTTSSASSFLLAGSSDNDIYRLKGETKNLKKLFSHESHQNILQNISDSRAVPALTIFSFGKLDLSSIGISCLLSVEEELIVGVRNGEMYGILWEGSVDEKFPWSLSNEPHKGSDYISDLKFSSILAGFVMATINGRVGFLPLSAADNRPANGIVSKSTSGTIIKYLDGIDSAVCVEINHKFRLVAIGLKNSHVIVCNINDKDHNLIINHKLSIDSCKVSQNSNIQLGYVNCLRYSPDNSVLVTSWNGGHFAIWSVFGSLIFCSQQWYLESLESRPKPIIMSSCSWDQEGYNLWLCTTQDLEVLESTEEFNDQDKGLESINSIFNFQKDEVLVISLAHSSLINCPSLACTSDSILLMSENQIYFGLSAPNQDNFDNWISIEIPKTYLNANYPIRHATIDCDCKNLALAGIRGMATYSLDTNQWKFLTKNNEEGFFVCGDLLWWKEYLIVSCFNFHNELFELRAYETNSEHYIDLTFTQTVPSEVTRMSIFENRLLVLYIDGNLSMFMLNLGLRRKSLSISAIENLHIEKQENSICVASLALTRLKYRNNHDDSILINHCGRLLLLERCQNKFKLASVISENVEKFWVRDIISNISPDISGTLYVSCGGITNQIRILLPNPSKPIILPINCDIYPLAISSQNAIVLGAESDILYNDCKLFSRFPYLTVKRQCRILLHRIIRELLNQEQDSRAREIAGSCQSLPYFAHCFELLLHEVLEDEASTTTTTNNKKNINLSQVIKFIKEFPVYPEIVIHCARKSDMSMWSYLFDDQAVGNPRKLFQECLENHKLDIAASCLLVLQGLDRNIVSQRMVEDLFEAANNDPKYKYLIKDLEGFITRAELGCLKTT